MTSVYTAKDLDAQIEELRAEISDFKRGLDSERAEKYMQAFVDDGLIHDYKRTKPKSYKSTVDRIVADAVASGQAHTRESLRELEEEKKKEREKRYTD